MMTLKDYFDSAILAALKQLNYDISNTSVTYSNRPDLSDYQSNVAMQMAKIVHKAPTVIANEIGQILVKDSSFSKVSVDGPGFINVKFSDEYLLNYKRFSPFSKRKVVIDYGGPNIAKEMHVGHLRSAIIGESIKRILRFCGDEVVGDVHFGDWGTPIGMLIAQLESEYTEAEMISASELPKLQDLSEMSALYKRASSNFKANDAFKEKARAATFELQNGNSVYRSVWKVLHDRSIEAVKANYTKLGVSFDLWLGESDTNDMLQTIVNDLIDRKIAVRSEGAVIVPMASDRAPLILRKSDGAYTYAITDLATIIQRQRDFSPDAILYVVDARQHEHFTQVFTVARMAKYVDEHVMLEHIAFGTVNGRDGKPFKTREGNVMNLKDLIELSEEKARAISDTRLQDAESESDIRKVAIGALKFQDLKNLRTSNYIFDTENFTKSEGKTGAYVQYAIARINSIMEKSKNSQDGHLKITHETERDIMLQINRFPESLALAYENFEPSVICDYVYTLAQKFSCFYAELPINGEPDVSIRKSRLKLCEIVREFLSRGLDLLGIESPARMLSKNVS